MREVATDVIVVGRRDQPSATVHDGVEDQGPLSGIAAGLAASTSDVNIVVACDMPLIKPAVLERLVATIGDHDACVAIVGGHASALCGVYRSRVATDAQALLDSGERRVMRLLDRVQTKRVDAALLRDSDPHLDTFVSVDTAYKYQWALARRDSR
jgi:molybdopterin-guanine dinucleotide biosynthesis protein A